jgi:hypothetical protein
METVTKPPTYFVRQHDTFVITHSSNVNHKLALNWRLLHKVEYWNKWHLLSVNPCDIVLKFKFKIFPLFNNLNFIIYSFKISITHYFLIFLFSFLSTLLHSYTSYLSSLIWSYLITTLIIYYFFLPIFMFVYLIIFVFCLQISNFVWWWLKEIWW